MENKKVFIVNIDKEGNKTYSERNLTPEEIQKTNEEERIQKGREEDMFENAEDLNCDKCGKIIGKVYANDLNGSRFYCDNC